jgi:hypothetical protein
MSEKIYGLIAEFDSPAAILHAAEKVRDAGYRRWDAFTPFPIHGMEGDVMKLGNSLVGWVALAGGAFMFANNSGLIWFANAFDYPLIVGGKPMFSAPMTFVPSYIMLIMGAAVGALIGMLGSTSFRACIIRCWIKNVLKLVSRDKFILVIGAQDEKFSETETRKLLEAHRRHARRHRGGQGLMRYIISILLIGAAIGAAVFGMLGLPGLSRKPPFELFPDMDRQAKLRPQEPFHFFTNGISSQLPPAGTVARSEPIRDGERPGLCFEDSPVNTGRITGTTNFVETNPLVVNAALLQRGRERFDIYCCAVPRPARRRQRHHQENRRHAGGREFARPAHRRNGRRRNFQHRHPRQRRDGRGRPAAADRRPLGGHRLSARALQLSWLGTTNDLTAEQSAALK